MTLPTWRSARRRWGTRTVSGWTMNVESSPSQSPQRQWWGHVESAVLAVHGGSTVYYSGSHNVFDYLCVCVLTYLMRMYLWSTCMLVFQYVRLLGQHLPPNRFWLVSVFWLRTAVKLMAKMFVLPPNVPESTNTRVLYFSIFSMCCLIGLATWQVFYLRRFFKAKKLIE